jgi:hypothetical protein
MKEMYVIAALLLGSSYGIAQVPNDSMPVFKPKKMDTASIVRPNNTVENMPVVTPEKLPPQENSTKVPMGENKSNPQSKGLPPRRKSGN